MAVITTEDLKKIFVEQSGLMTPEVFATLAAQEQTLNRPLSELLMEQAFVSPRYYLELLGDYFGVPVTDLKNTDIDLATLNKVSARFATEHLAVPFGTDGDVVKVAFANPADKSTQPALEQVLGQKIQPFVATEKAIRRALVLFDKNIETSLAELATVAQAVKQGENITVEAASITTLLDAIVSAAYLSGASDIHIEPYASEIIVRFRVDGLLRTVARVPKELHKPLIAKLKVLSQLKLDEHRLPQDGRFNLNIQQQEIDFRLSTVPSMYGEKAVLRMLIKEAAYFDIHAVGLLDSDLELVTRYLKRPYGMFLVCGPTGSGKTTTLYACLQQIGLEKIDVVNISTIEDPIEYTLPRLTQIQIHPEIDLTFAAGLRALLRQDPDIIMVGEIRDQETADVAVRSALVGRLLLSSLHTNDAVGAIPRLLDMGVEPYLVSSTLSLVISQRLARRLCTHCRESYTIGDEEWQTIQTLVDVDRVTATLERHEILSKKNDLREATFFRSKGCSRCDNTGYLGRVALYEILEITDRLRPLISARADTLLLRKTAEEDGMKSMLVDGIAKALLGITDLKEVLRRTL